jgi:hypothetical protein
MEAGHSIFSPIAHSHAIAVHGGLAKDWGYWRNIDMEWIRLCGAVWVLQLQGWRESVGVTEEIRYAKIMQIPVRYVLYPELDIKDKP